MRKLLSHYAGHWRTLGPGTARDGAYAGGALTPLQLDGSLQRLGLRLGGDCLSIQVAGLPLHILRTITLKRTGAPPVAESRSFVSCRVVPSPHIDATYIAGLRDANLVLNHLEVACPRLFQPRGLLTDGDGALWKRIYISTDLVAWVSDGAVYYADARDQIVHDLGSERAWRRGSLPISCGRLPDGYYFAQLRGRALARDQTTTGG